MISDAAIAKLCAEIYRADPTAWGHFDSGDGTDQICWGMKAVDGVKVVVFRGSVTFEDWRRDFNAWALPFNQSRLGHVHPGFLLGMDTVWSELMTMMALDFSDVVVAGHSLGAARADVLTGFMVAEGLPPVRRVVFGEPKPGFPDFAKLIADVPAASYCNGDAKGHDLITDVPFNFPPQNYVRPTPLIPVSASPLAADRWGVFAYHHMALYEAAMAKQSGV